MSNLIYKCFSILLFKTITLDIIFCLETVVYHSLPQVHTSANLKNLSFHCGKEGAACKWIVPHLNYTYSCEFCGDLCPLKLEKYFNSKKSGDVICSFTQSDTEYEIHINLTVADNSEVLSDNWCHKNSFPCPRVKSDYYKDWNKERIKPLPKFLSQRRKLFKKNVFNFQSYHPHRNIIILNLFQQSHFTMHCPASGDPLPTVSYFWNGKKFTQSGKNATISKFQITLHFDDLSEKSGVLTCRADNYRGYDMLHFVIYTVNHTGDVNLDINLTGGHKMIKASDRRVTVDQSQYPDDIYHTWIYSRTSHSARHYPDVYLSTKETSLELRPGKHASNYGLLFLIVCYSPSNTTAECVFKEFRFDRGRFEYYFVTTESGKVASSPQFTSTMKAETNTNGFGIDKNASSEEIFPIGWTDRILLIAILIVIGLTLIIFLIWCCPRMETSGCRDACCQIAQIVRKGTLFKEDQVTYVRNVNYGSSTYFLPLVNQPSIASSTAPLKSSMAHRNIAARRPTVPFPLLRPCISQNRESESSEATTYLSVINHSPVIPVIKAPTSNVYNPSPANQKKIQFANQSVLLTNPDRELPQISKLSLVLNKQIGSGAFGRVFSGKFYSDDKSAFQIVAVKEILDNSELRSDVNVLMKEIDMMKRVGSHRNIVSIIGYCLDYGDSPLIVMEMCAKGSLKNYLEALSFNNFASPDVLMPQLMLFSYDIACGMVHLSERKIIHRDLAARNIVLNDDYCCKIADFGLSRQLPRSSDYYWRINGTLPLKWMAPEVTQERKFSTKADVWSFGILLWEIFSLGENPYPNFPIEQISDLIKNGYRMPHPKHCPPLIGTLMRRCWQYSSKDRPTFPGIQQILQHSPLLTTNNTNV